ncbi:MAG: amino acid permease [Planctomycetota bacterium]
MPESPEPERRVLGATGGAALVVASMVGAGVFGTTGYLAASLGSGRDILLAWTLGGVLALCGALCFAELGGMMPEAGAEYRYVRRIFGRRAGFLCGFFSFSAGFAAPIAGVALVLGRYLVAMGLPGGAALWGALAILGAAAAQLGGLRWSAGVNGGLAAAKVALLALFGLAGILVPAARDPEALALAQPGPLSAAFASALVLVAFAYTGWNAAAYLAGEMREPGRTLPRALVLGTAAVTVLYVLVNVAYLRAAAPAEMAGTAEVGHLAAIRLFGAEVGRFFGVAISLMLVSTILAFTIAGPRIPLAMAEEGQVPAALGRRDARGVPRAAVALQAALALALLPFEPDAILIYVGMALSLFAGLAVAGVIVMRRREPERPRPFRVPLHPLPAIAFILLAGGMVVFSAKDRPEPALATLGTAAVGLALERAFRR